MKKLYIYSAKGKKLDVYNPYIDDLIHSFGEYYTFVNLEKPSKTGIFDILKYITKLDYIIFHWIEKLPEMKGGFLQTIFLFFLIPVLKLFRIKVIWTMHNKMSHSGKSPRLTKAIFKLMLRKSNLILTHSNEGIDFGDQLVSGSMHFTYYLPHPVKDRRLDRIPTKEYDILIWGTISPYKGIDKFLDYLYNNNLEKKYRILIVGKVSNPEYDMQLQKYGNDSITIENRFIEDELLQNLISKSKLVLFTYSKASILSSGVLMDSLGYGANVIGPTVGAFADLSKDGIINNYYDHDDMIQKIDSQISEGGKVNKSALDNFLMENSWPKYAEKVHRIIKGLK